MQKSYCDGARDPDNFEDEDNALDCYGETCFVGASEVFGNYSEEDVSDENKECCGDDEGENLSLDCHAPNDVLNNPYCCPVDRPYGNSHANYACTKEDYCFEASSITITTECADSCNSGDTVTFTIDGISDGDPVYVQIDAKSSDESCNVSYTDGTIQGFYSDNEITFTDDENTFTWQVPSSLPSECQGANVEFQAIGLYTDVARETSVFYKEIGGELTFGS